MKNAYVYVKACERRILDANRIKEYLTKNGYKVINKPSNADIIFYVTCAVFNSDTELALQKIKEFKKYNAELIVAGCLPLIDKNKLDEIFQGKILTTRDINKIDELFSEHTIKFKDIDDSNLIGENVLFEDLKNSKSIKNRFYKIKWINKTFTKSKSNILSNKKDGYSKLTQSIKTSKNEPYYLRISRGCLGNCSYCGIKKAIGSHKSKPIKEIMKEFKKGLKKGYTRFIITSDDVGAYGLDIGSSFPKLLKNLTRIEGNYTIEPVGLNPKWIVKYIDELEEIVKKGKIRTIQSPIQSASNRILKLMNRYNDTKKIKNAFERLKRLQPNLQLNTHYILGFPSEKKVDFVETLSFIKDLDFNGGYIFPFSCKSGSKAENIEPKISNKEISKRLNYSKEYLKKAGYKILYRPKINLFAFEKKY